MSNKILHNSPLALYVHWPYCLAKCPYCDFNSHVSDTVDHEQWRKAYEADLKAHKEKLGARRITSIFFGGGTPSLMQPQTIAHVINTAQELWHFDNNIEITMEANPTSIEAQKFQDFKEAGINRVSVGVQSLIDTDLKALGREHNATEAMQAVDIAQNTFNRFSFDLIYTREGQELKDWEKELKQALPMAQGGHISLYQLTIEPGTKFKTLFDSGRLILPDDDTSAAFYELTRDMMGDAGLPMYEISNYARADEQSRHNLTYWQYGDYAGIGPGAHGRLRVTDENNNIKTISTRGHKAPPKWLEHVLREKHAEAPFQNAHALSAQDQLEEMVLVGLRLREGLAYSDVKARTGLNLEEFISKPHLKMLSEEGLVQQGEDRLRLTDKGLPLLDGVTAALLA
jgi:oxygen-independent coproporphyrinogen-3 oxidase